MDVVFDIGKDGKRFTAQGLRSAEAIFRRLAYRGYTITETCAQVLKVSERTAVALTKEMTKIVALHTEPLPPPAA